MSPADKAYVYINFVGLWLFVIYVTYRLGPPK